MRQYHQILFVGTGGICRAPMCEAIMKSKLTTEDLDIGSRGVVVLFPEPVNPKVIAILKSHGLSLDNHRTVALSNEDFAEDCLILTINEHLRERILADYPEHQNVYALCDFVDSPDEVPDPYGAPLVEYENCYRLLNTLIDKLIFKIKEDVI